jgi:hypothetical protein
VMLPQSMQQAPLQTQAQGQVNITANMPNILTQLMPQQNLPIPIMNLNVSNPQISQNKPGLPQSQIPQQMFMPRMQNVNARPSMPLPMLSQTQINAMFQNNPVLFMNFMRNPNAFQGMIQPPNLPNMPVGLPMPSNNTQSKLKNFKFFFKKIVFLQMKKLFLMLQITIITLTSKFKGT